MVAEFKTFASGVGVKIDEAAFEADATFIKAMIRYDIDLALFGVAAARRHLFASRPPGAVRPQPVHARPSS